MGVDTSQGFEVGTRDFTHYHGLPAVEITVASGRQVIYPMACHVEGDTVAMPEPLACEQVAVGAASLANGQTLSARGQAYLTALQTKQQTGIFDPEY